MKVQAPDGQQFRKIVEATARNLQVAALPPAKSRFLADLSPAAIGPALTIHQGSNTFDADRFILLGNRHIGEYGFTNLPGPAYLRDIRLAPDVLANMLRNILQSRAPSKEDIYRSLIDLPILGQGSSRNAENISADIMLVDRSGSQLPVHLSITKPNDQEVRILLFQDQAFLSVGLSSPNPSNAALPFIQINVGLSQIIGALMIAGEKRTSQKLAAPEAAQGKNKQHILRQAIYAGLAFVTILLLLIFPS